MTITHALLACCALLILSGVTGLVLYVRYRQAITLNKTYESEIADLKEGNTKHVYHAEQVENKLTKKIDEIIFKRTR
mgnify:FL=1